jgi:hypothetical protein
MKISQEYYTGGEKVRANQYISKLNNKDTYLNGLIKFSLGKYGEARKIFKKLKSIDSKMFYYYQFCKIFHNALLTKFVDFDLNWIFLLLGPIYYAIIYSRYRNSGARHRHELETKKKMDNLRTVDQLVTRRTGLRNSRMSGANNHMVSGQSAGSQFLSGLTQGSPVASFIKENMDKDNN